MVLFNVPLELIHSFKFEGNFKSVSGNSERNQVATAHMSWGFCLKMELLEWDGLPLVSNDDKQDNQWQNCTAPDCNGIIREIIDATCHSVEDNTKLFYGSSGCQQLLPLPFGCEQWEGKWWIRWQIYWLPVMWGSGCCVWWRAGRSAMSQGHGCKKQGVLR